MFRFSVIFFCALFSVPVLAHAQILTGYSGAVPDVAVEQDLSSTLNGTQDRQVPSSDAVELFSLGDVDSLPRNTTLTRSSPVVREAPSADAEEPVDLDADTLDYNEETQIITATGDVFLQQSGRILRADEVVYNLTNDKVEARGNVVINEPTGDIYFADYMELEDKMKDGFVENIQAKLGDGSTFDARDGQRVGGNEIIMYDARYTPCKLCGDDDPVDTDALWQIRASEVKHDKEARSISYENARFEVLGVPVAYTPYFSHPDGTIDRKSGFLSPSFGFRSNLGVFAQTDYYWNIAPDKDATFGLLGFTDENPLGLIGYRQRWNNAGLNIDSGITYSSERGVVDEELRGHVFADGLWDINQKWRAGFDVEWASDDRYLRQYDFASEDVLENQIFAERFSGRNYAVGRLLAFQDTRSGDSEQDQPEILPEIFASFIGEPNSVPLIKGRWSFEGSTLGLRRDGDAQDVNRISGHGAWFRRFVSDYGLVGKTNADARWDFYSARDRDVSTVGSNIENNSTDSRFFPSFSAEASYPVAKQYASLQARVEPVVSVTFAENIDVNNDIPNEDSQDVQLDASNLFESNRFPGFDRIEDTSHLTYGLRAGLYGHGGSRGEVFLGQSYRFDKEDNSFPEGSGLDRQSSDFVGQISGRYADVYDLNYRFQLDGQRITSRRHELDASADWNRFRLSANYLYASPLAGTEFSDSREQLTTDAQYYLSREWRLRAGARYDFGEDEGFRTNYGGIDYLGDCLFWSVIAQRNFTDDDSGESDTEVLFRIGLKNLGDFEVSGLREDDGASYASLNGCKSPI